MPEKGNTSSQKIGQKLREMGVQISKITCSGHKRAILSAKFLRKGYTENSGIEKPKIHLFLKSHEAHGIFQNDKFHPGLNKK